MTARPSKNEDQYCMEHELKRRFQKQVEEQQATTESEKRRLKELHWMHCPKCGQELAMEECGTVETDVCPGCRGLWLDANELEAIVESEVKRNPFRSFLQVLGGR